MITPKTKVGDLHWTKQTVELKKRVDELEAILKTVEEYFDQRADAEYFTDKAAPQGNEEMTLLVDIRAVLSRQVTQPNHRPYRS